MAKVGDLVSIGDQQLSVTNVKIVEVAAGQVEARAVLDNRRGRPRTGVGPTKAKAMAALDKKLGLV